MVKPTRGLRQGDPLSPYIFILCSEVLSGLCHRSQEEGRLLGIRVSQRSPRVNHLLSADDTMIFCQANQKSGNELLTILKKYESASGQQINRQNSAITFSAKTNNTVKQQVKNALGIQQEGGNGKYLGLPEHFGRKKKDLFSRIVDRIKQKARSWSTKRLSSAGKLTMLKSVLAAMPTYTMTCFKLPVSLTKRIQSALTRFWWDGNDEQRKTSWIAWTKLVKSRKEGGLGFKDLQCFNNALLAKVSWRILTKPDCLLARILLSKYSHDTTFLESRTPAMASHGWRGICLGRDLLKPHVGKAIGDGRETRIWNDAWLSLEEQQRPIGPPPEASTDMLVADLMTSNTKRWDIEKIRNIVPRAEADIRELKTSKRGAARDSYIWLPTETGEYTAKSGYYECLKQNPEEKINEQEAQGERFNWLKSIWNIRSSPKTKMFMWKAMNGALPVGETLKARNINTTVRCPYCGEEETTMHLFFHCSFVEQVWRLVPCKDQIDPMSVQDIQAGIELAPHIICLPPTGIGEGPLLPWLVWRIWIVRNLLIFKRKSQSAEEIVTQAVSYAREWQAAQQRKSKQETKTPNQFRSIRQIPRGNWTTFKSDVAWKEENKVAGLGWIIYNGINTNREEILLQGSSTQRFVKSPLSAEGLALLTALHKAKDLGIKNLIVASDSQQLIKAINKEISTKELHGILHDILDLALVFEKVLFVYVPREENRQADVLAKQALIDFVI
ncbi:unnamed protein product [Microthlaspi erraticum]|uniref:RNase H type-1 domain-containing protein n=1 Tax=Microthlaspi erraticum TaxID=1685480 RepID=A0A6D2LP21_9BRAS|nr:unnamed protein product [Microthlaspi erraticum]